MSIDHAFGQPSRRHFLRGVGVALALPWMESLPFIAAVCALIAVLTFLPQVVLWLPSLAFGH